ncbi:MAG: hypothetical protein WCK35_10355 [Chloroflexota bacterium]
MRKLLIIFLLVLTACSSLTPQAWIVSPATTSLLKVIAHPDGPLYVGDQVSFEVIDSTKTLPPNSRVGISLAGKSLGDQNFGSYGLGGRSQATFYWAWDTHGLKPGEYTLTFSLKSGTLQWDEKIRLYPAKSVPAPEPDAHWKTMETVCCTVHYISGTAAERDLDLLSALVETQLADVEKRMGEKAVKKISITYFPRTLGHGGFAADGIYISYLDRNYAGGTTAQITHHEMVHWLDSQIGGKLRPSILQEGLAVYMSDGHFKAEPILPRLAALVDLGWYIPLPRLIDSFYNSQHEIGYAEAAGLVGYLVTTYGWEGFNRFYRSISPVPQGTESSAMDVALQAQLGISLERLEQNFLIFIHDQVYDDAIRTDLRLTVNFYDTVRRYEAVLDPSAYFLNAWLPDVVHMRQYDIVADFLRHPDSLLNQQIESLLVEGDVNLRTKAYTAADIKIRMVNALLDLYGSSVQ